MSRLYTIDLYIQPRPEYMMDIGDFLEEWRMGVMDYTDLFENTRVYYGRISLTGGETEIEAHNRLKKLLPSQFKVASKWWREEDRQPNEEISDEEFKW